MTPVKMDPTQMQIELETLRAELARVTAQRDRYRAGLESLMKEYIPFTAADIADAEKNGHTFERLMENIQPILKGSAHAG